jgi:hypothetical protein
VQDVGGGQIPRGVVQGTGGRQDHSEAVGSAAGRILVARAARWCRRWARDASGWGKCGRADGISVRAICCRRRGEDATMGRGTRRVRLRDAAVWGIASEERESRDGVGQWD